METSTSPVSPEQISRALQQVTRQTADPRAGIFGPASMSWRIDRESALFLGAGRAALLQLAHPWVAAALDQHSNLRSDPLARFHNTFRIVFTMVFGTLEQALSSSQYLYQLHTRVQGVIPAAAGAYPAGSSYLANELAALRWVFATLVESALLAYEVALPALTAQEKQAYYEESKTLALLFGIDGGGLPVDYAGFEEYNCTMWNSELLAVNDLSREMAHRVLHGRGSWVPIPSWYRSLTAMWLSDRLREAFQLPFGSAQEREATRALRWLPTLYRQMPSPLRYVGPYQEARARLDSRPAGLLTRISNRFWMGQSHLLFSQTHR